MAEKRYVVIVAYEPEKDKLYDTCACIIKQGSNPIIVDNSEKEKISEEDLPANAILISLGENKGIAAALNEGIRYVRKCNANIITFFDQDSVVTGNILDELQQGVISLQGVVAPIYIDAASGNEYPSHVVSQIGMMKDVYSLNKSTPQKVDIVITSGTTLYMDVFDNVGEFDEDFFIDFVDIEWCMRCKKKSIPIYVLPYVQMTHCIGIKTICCGGIRVNKHTPYRTYYKVRNSFILLRKVDNLVFCLRQIIPALIHNFLCIIGDSNWKEYLQYYYKGIIDGIRGKKGRLER